MKTLLLLVAAWLVLSCATAKATDLTTIARSIAKEPTYKTKPKYCLLVFGHEAKTRVWVVLDGDVLYVDRNGNGDLTEQGEAVKPTPWLTIPGPDDPGQKYRLFKAGEVREAGAKVKHSLTFREERRWGRSGYSAEVLVRGRHEQVAYFLATEAPGGAPVAWFNGPLTVHPYGANQTLGRNAEPSTISFAVGTPGLATTTTIAYDGVIPNGALPVAEIEFPGRRLGDPPVKKRLRFDHRC
jgi:hypothetical protein